MTSQKSPFTGLILLSGIDSPGITEDLFSTLAEFSVTVLDIQQIVIRGRLILTALIALNKAHAGAIEADVEQCAQRLGVDIAISFSEEPPEAIDAKTNLVHITILGAELKPKVIADVAAQLAQRGVNIESISRATSSPITAFELLVSGATEQEIRACLHSLSTDQGVDVAVQIGGPLKWARKLVLLDVDSTLIQQEVIELLAAKAGVQAEVKAITDSAMRGELDFAQSLMTRVALLEGLPESVIAEVRQEVLLTPGARTLIRTLQKLGHAVAVVSGGFVEVIEPLLLELNIEYYRANSLEIVAGKLTGRLNGEIVDRAAKATALREFANVIGVELAQTIAIGDGANDLDMIAAAGLGIAFSAKPAVREAADASITRQNLDGVLYLMGIAREDFDEAD